MFFFNLYTLIKFWFTDYPQSKQEKGKKLCTKPQIYQRGD